MEEREARSIGSLVQAYTSDAKRLKPGRCFHASFVSPLKDTQLLCVAGWTGQHTGEVLGTARKRDI